MIAITMFETSDGALHKSQREATRHADERYGAAITSLAHKMMHVNKYKEMVDFIEANLHLFVELKCLQKDMILKNPEEEV